MTDPLAISLSGLETKTSRRTDMERFVEASGWPEADIKPLAGDASFRRYERVFGEGRQAVLMDAPPEKEDTAPFILVDRYLVDAGFSAPHIFAEDTSNGFLLLEDLGDDSYTRLLARYPEKEEELYLAAIETLAELHNKPVTLDVPAYDHAALMREVGLFTEWFLPAVMGNSVQDKSLGAEFLSIWDALLTAHSPAKDVVVLRDYHADNLLWLPERAGVKRTGLLDFQDALIGSPAYDVVSLLEDARRDVLPETVDAAIHRYLELTGKDEAEFRAYYALLGAQRNAKIIGIFVRLGVRDGKKHYTGYLPRVWGHLMQDLQHPWLAPIKAWVNKHIKPEWQGALSL